MSAIDRKFIQLFSSFYYNIINFIIPLVLSNIYVCLTKLFVWWAHNLFFEASNEISFIYHGWKKGRNVLSNICVNWSCITCKSESVLPKKGIRHQICVIGRVNDWLGIRKHFDIYIFWVHTWTTEKYRMLIAMCVRSNVWNKNHRFF